MRIIKKNDIGKPFVSSTSEIIYEMIGKPAKIGGATNHSFAYVVIPPGISSPAHYHKISEETYYLLSGKARLVINDQEFFLEPTHACLIMPFENHQIFNIDKDKNLEFIVVSAPAWVPADTSS